MIRILAAVLTWLALCGAALAGPLTTMGAGGFTPAAGPMYLVLEADGTSKFLIETVGTPAFQAAASGGASGTTNTVALDVGSDQDRAVFVAVCSNTGQGNATGVTYAGNALTKVPSSEVSSGSANIELWYGATTATGSNNVVATFDSTTDSVVGAMALDPVQQTGTLVGTVTTGTALASSAVSISVTSASSEIVVDGTCIDSAVTHTAGAGQTERWDTQELTGGDITSAGSDEAGAGSVTMSWTLSAAQNWAAAGVSFKPGSVTDGSAILLE